MAGEKAGDPTAVANSSLVFQPSRESATDMSLRSEVNMTNCFRHRRRFFDRFPSIDCNILIAYWMMAGYLGPVDSVRRSYQIGHKILMKLAKRKILKPYASGVPDDINKAGLSGDSAINCDHQGFCDMENVGFFDLLELDHYPNVTLTNGVLKDEKSSVLLVDGNRLSRQLFSSCSRLECVAFFNLMPNAVDCLLSNIEDLSVLILRGCDFSSQEISLLFEDSSAPLTTSQGTSVMCDPPKTREFTNLTVLEISGSARLTDIPEVVFSKLDKLACINLSGLPISILPPNCFSRLTKRLRWLIIRGCKKLQVLPSIRDLEKLEVLDISRCHSLYKSVSQQVKSSCLQVIDLSHTRLPKVPILETKVLTHMFLRDSVISLLLNVKGLSSLQVLDLSGAKKIATIKDLLQHHNLIVLDLSGTEIKSIDPVSDKARLRKLRLRDCKDLEKLPSMEKLESLEVFDVSGCEKLAGSLDLINLRKLEELDLSETKVVPSRSFAIHACLIRLSLRRLRLDSLVTLGALTNLEELDLNGVVDISSPGKLNIEFLRSLEKLQTLDLSNTFVQELPEIPNLISLKELLLADCRHLRSAPGLKLLTKLETLDLSIQDEAHTEILFFSVPSSLQKLVLTNRSGVHKLFPLPTPKLEILDVRGTDVAAIPYGTMARMKCFRFPAMIDLTGVRLDKIGTLKEKLVKDDNDLSQPVEIKISRSAGSKFSMSAGTNRFFHLQSNQGENAWEAFVYQFSESELPKDGGDGIRLQGDEFVLMNGHPWPRLSLNTQVKGRSVEIHGLPEDIPIQGSIQNSLRQADNVAFVGNDFSDSLSCLCPNTVEVCCVRGCPNMETLLTGDTTMAILAISHLVGLKSIFDDNVTTENIKSLKCIHIDSCPLLSEVIPFSKVPENLTTLKIKFCGKLSTLSKGSLVLSKLRNLVLFELPELEDTSAQLPNLVKLSISRCGSLKNIDALVKSARHSLEQLLLDSCPVIEHVFPSSSLPMKKLEVLKITSCSALETLFIDTGSSSSSVSSLSKLHLQNLKLWDLPNLKDIGGELSSESPPQLDPFLSQNIAHQVNHASMCHGNFPSTQAWFGSTFKVGME